MTELEQARAHLRECQARLALSRTTHVNSFGVTITTDMNRDGRTRNEDAVKAALSWVWDAQEREHYAAIASIVKASESIDPALLAAIFDGRDP